LRQVFNDTDADVLWLIVGAPEEPEFLPGAKTKPDMSLIYPVDPKGVAERISRRGMAAQVLRTDTTTLAARHPTWRPAQPLLS
jgi:hypothetical protein